MAKINKIKMTKIKNWYWIIACGFFFCIGFIVGKIPFIMPVQTNSYISSQNAGNSSRLIFTVPQVPLPPDWSSKENLPGNSFETAFPLNTGIQTQGTLNQDNVIDYYAFTLKDPSQVIINITNVPKALYWILYNTDRKEIASSYRTGATQGQTQISLQDPGTYYIKVWADYHQFTNYPYTIRLNVLPFFE